MHTIVMDDEIATLRQALTDAESRASEQQRLRRGPGAALWRSSADAKGNSRLLCHVSGPKGLEDAGKFLPQVY